MRVNANAANQQLNRAAMGAAALRDTNGEIGFTDNSEIQVANLTINGQEQKQLVITNCEIGVTRLPRNVYAGKLLALLAPAANNANEAAEYINAQHIIGVRVTVQFVQGGNYWTISAVEPRVAQPQATPEEEAPTA